MKYLLPADSTRIINADIPSSGTVRLLVAVLMLNNPVSCLGVRVNSSGGDGKVVEPGKKKKERERER